MLILQWQHADEQGDTDVTLRQLRKRCERLVADLDMPDTFDMHGLCRLLGDRRGRPIHLVPISLPVHTVCGMCVPTGAFDAIFYEQETSPMHQMLIVGHEVGHLLAGHKPAAVLDPNASTLLLPDLDPQTVQRFLGRSNYDAQEEQEAEMIGSLLLRRIRNSTGSDEQDMPRAEPEAALYHRLRQSLEHPDR